CARWREWRWRSAYRRCFNRFWPVLKVWKFRRLDGLILDLPLTPLAVIGPHGGVIIHRGALDIPVGDDIGGTVVHGTQAGLHQADIGAAAVMQETQRREIAIDIAAREIAHRGGTAEGQHQIGTLTDAIDP